MRKSYIALVLCAIVLFCPVSAYASVSVPFSWVEDGKTYIGTFPINNANQSVKEFWDEFKNTDTDWLLFVDKQVGFGYVHFSFVLIPPDTVVSYFKNPSENAFGAQYKTLDGKFVECRFLDISSDPTGKILSNTYRLGSGPTSPSSMDIFLGGKHSSISSLPSLMLPFMGDISSSYEIVDDLPKPDPPPSSSSEPEPPPVDPPSPPPVTQPPIGFPTFPKVEGKYIFYDTTVWNKFADSVRSSIGSTVNVGMGIFSIILGIWVTIWIVRQFTGVKNHANKD